MQATTLLLLLLLGITLIVSLPPPSPSRPELWLYGLGPYSITADGPNAINPFIDQAISYGYTGAVINEYKFSILNSVGAPPNFYNNLPPILDHMQSKGFKYIATIDPFGYSDGILSTNYNLAEGQKVVGTPYTVSGSQLVLDATYAGLTNGNFDAGTLTGWNIIDADRVSRDTATTQGGSTASVKIVNGASGNARITQTLNLTPYRQYHMRCYISTSGFSASLVQVVVLDLNKGAKALNYNQIRPGPNQGFTAYDTTFNSRADTSNLRLYIGVWGSQSGTLWVDTCSIEEIGLFNVLRRPGTPVSVYLTSNPATTFSEGSDYDNIQDPLAWNAGAQFNLWHNPPTVTLPQGTSLQQGQKVSIDYYGVHPIDAGGNYYQTGACLSEQQIADYIDVNIVNVSALLPPQTPYFLGYDEMRHMGSCSLCASKYPTAGELLAWHVSDTITKVKSLPTTKDSKIYLWSDMFDPTHNAVDNYYNVPTTIAGSWKGVPCGTNIMNWLRQTPSFEFFSANLSLPQIVAGYYDSGDGAGSATSELNSAKGIPGIQGFMYTTFTSDWNQMQQYAATVLAGWNSTISAEGDTDYYAKCAASNPPTTGSNNNGGSSSSSRTTSFWSDLL